jgi:hypothetical protein
MQICTISIPVMEYTRPDMRNKVVNSVFGFFFFLISFVSPWIAVGVGDWKYFLIVISLPTLLIPLFYFVTFDSAEWLISKGRVDKAIDIFKKIAKMNKQVLDENTIQQFRNGCNNFVSNLPKNSKHENFFHLFKTPRLRRITILCLIKSLVFLH